MLRVPPSAHAAGRGRGFEIAQDGSAPDEFTIACAPLARPKRRSTPMVKRLMSRTAFGRLLAEQGVWEERIANARIDIEMTRLLCLKAADHDGPAGNKAAQAKLR